MKSRLPLMTAVILCLLSAKPALAKETKCHLTFAIESFAFVYESGKGSGTITCDNGQSARVKIRTHGGGANFGENKITNGHGSFSKVNNIKELFGGYASSSAHASAGAGARAEAVTKGDISLSLSGTGKGVGIGLGFGSFVIKPIGKK
jgi:hypothetical protein